MLRYALFFGTNIAVIAVLSIVLGVVLPMFGIQVTGTVQMLIFAAGLGFVGSFISLWMSKGIALRSTGAQVIENPSNETERWLVDTVTRQAKEAGIKTPDVAIYGGPELNAFATGRSRNNSLVAVSAGLMNGMQRDEIEAVLAHEVSHVANGDMVTMALLQGVLNTFVIFFSRIIASRISNSTMVYLAVSVVLQMVFGALASIIAMWFSRRREFRADAGAAKLSDKNKMIAALERLAQNSGESTLPDSVQAFGISGKRHMKLFMTHPPLADRIQSTLR